MSDVILVTLADGREIDYSVALSKMDKAILAAVREQEIIYEINCGDNYTAQEVLEAYCWLHKNKFGADFDAYALSEAAAIDVQKVVHFDSNMFCRFIP